MILRTSCHTSDIWHPGKVSHRKHKKIKDIGQSWCNKFRWAEKRQNWKNIKSDPQKRTENLPKIDFIVKIGPYLRCKHTHYEYVIERLRYVAIVKLRAWFPSKERTMSKASTTRRSRVKRTSLFLMVFFVKKIIKKTFTFIPTFRLLSNQKEVGFT